ncbi:MAG: Stp1/IreP family PP2C-type Ser/Thr phosphatase [Acutalibacteraceae bacterium]
MNTVGSSDIGKRRACNEDSFRFGRCEDGVPWAVVCDGMGGAKGGQTASTIAADMVSRKIEKCYNKLMSDLSIENLLLSAITTANVAIYDRAAADEALEGMGTTIVACMIKNDVACIAHVGDSRAYIISDKKIRQITKDHSLVQEMYDKGQITKEQFDNHPNKNIITRALGVSEEVEIDFDSEDVKEGDVIILCTDGLCGCVSDDVLLDTYLSCDFENLAGKYIELANDSGGRDNITVVVIKC